MANSYPQNVGAFVPTTYIWDVAQIKEIDVSSPEFKELLVRLYQNVSNIANVLNVKESGYYALSEFVTGKQYFINPALNSTTSTTPVFRQVFRKVINFGALPNTGTKSVPHLIPLTAAVTFTHIYATASDTTGFHYIPIPYASPVLVDNIELNADLTNVNITTGSNRTNFNITYVVLEYIKT
jgi:hypothetical protein